MYDAFNQKHEATIQKHDVILNRLVEDNKEFRSHLSKLTTTLSVNEKGNFHPKLISHMVNIWLKVLKISLTMSISM